MSIYWSMMIYTCVCLHPDFSDSGKQLIGCSTDTADMIGCTDHAGFEESTSLQEVAEPAEPADVWRSNFRQLDVSNTLDPRFTGWHQMCKNSFPRNGGKHTYRKALFFEWSTNRFRSLVSFFLKNQWFFGRNQFVEVVDLDAESQEIIWGPSNRSVV